MRRLISLAGFICAVSAAGVVGAVAWAVPAGAEQSPAASIPEPLRPDLTALRGLVGTWACSTKSSRRANAFTGTATYGFDPDGRWLINSGTSNPAPWFPFNGASTEFITYDTARRHWVDIYVDSAGNYQVSTSPGPKGNIWLWHDLGLQGPTGDIVSYGDAMTIVQAKTLTKEYRFKTKAGKVFDVKTACKRML